MTFVKVNSDFLWNFAYFKSKSIKKVCSSYNVFLLNCCKVLYFIFFLINCFLTGISSSKSWGCNRSGKTVKKHAHACDCFRDTESIGIIVFFIYNVVPKSSNE